MADYNINEPFLLHLFQMYNDNSLFPPQMFPTEYVQGYTAALQDVIDVFNYIDDDLKHHKRKRTAKTYQAIAKCMLDNRAILREEPNAFVRCNDKADGGFEVYVAKRRTT